MRKNWRKGGNEKQRNGKENGEFEKVHYLGNEIIQILVSGVLHLQGLLTNVIQGLIVKTKGSISVFDQLVEG